MLELLPIASAGFALGLAHAFEADHLAAATTMAADPLRGASGSRFAPLLWAVGHAVGLFALGCVAIALSSSIPLNLSTWAEQLVGPLLVFLGVRTIIRSGIFHRHRHEHNAAVHEHYHVHLGHREHHHAPDAADRADRRGHSALLVGAFHGIAGTGGALLLAATAGFEHPAHALTFLFALGLGTVLAMGAYSGVFALAGRWLQRRESLVQVAMSLCGMVSVGVGALWISNTLFTS